MGERRPPECDMTNVISMEAWKQGVVEPEGVYDPLAGFKVVDPLSYYAIKNVLDRLDGEAASKELVVVKKDVDTPFSVQATENERGRYYAVKRNEQDEEEITLDLQLLSEKQEKRMKEPLQRMVLAAAVGYHRLETGGLVKRSKPLTELRIGEAKVNLGGAAREMQLTTIRAAAGLALLAATPNRPALRQDIRDYLEESLGDRLHYARSKQAYEGIVSSRALRSEEVISDRLVGFCHPLNQHEINYVLSDPAQDTV